MNWNDYFLNLAHAVALKSKDRTKVGCVLVGPDREIRSTGWNGFARGVYELPAREGVPEKLDWVIHAESNAVANAARCGTALNGCKAYVTHFCCNNCADLLIQSGICEVVIGDGKLNGNYKNDVAMQKFKEAGIPVFKDGEYVRG